MRTKEELKKHLDWINQNLEGLTAKKLEVEKQLEEVESTDFDLKKLMPVGSVWLGLFKITSHYAFKNQRKYYNEPLFNYVNEDYDILSLYHAHKIVKAAQRHVKYTGEYFRLTDALGTAEADGVLQNLE